MLHFAYGSNMDRRLMRRRCAGARLIGGAVLRDHRFIITTDGYASVAAARGAVVHGLLWHLTPRDLAAIDRTRALARPGREHLLVQPAGPG